MDQDQLRAAATRVIIRCNGYSRRMCEGFLAQCQEAEIAGLAALEKDLAADDAAGNVGERFCLLWGEIHDRLMVEREAAEKAAKEAAVKEAEPAAQGGNDLEASAPGS